ncbi:MAG: sugar transferase, partial [Bacteroidales bacterium]|nr:sugar transferase [Bacteroidales bacterium]
MYRKFFKRFLDISVSLTALLLLGWLIVLFMLLLHFANKGAGVFFLQPRPGKDAKIFKVIKFKTM